MRTTITVGISLNLPLHERAVDIDLTALAVELDVTRVITMMVDMGGLTGPPMTWLNYNGGPLNDAHHPISPGEQRGVSDDGNILPAKAPARG